MKPNEWVWTELTESLKPERKAGESVPTECLIEGHTAWVPRQSWVDKGYVERTEAKSE